MNIGIITFHWACNYGAVLQAYALMKHLTNTGHNVEIIDYRPGWAKDVAPLKISINPYQILQYANEKYKRHIFDRFRKKYLNLSDCTYKSIEELYNINKYDYIITGSDQVFNPDIIAPGGKIDKTYLLDFPIMHGMKISYAASFGNSSLASEYRVIFQKALSKFSAISVRENSGIKIIQDLGINQVISVPDPTILIDDYSSFILKGYTEKDYIFSFLFQDSIESKQCLNDVQEIFNNAKVINILDLKKKIKGASGIIHPSINKWVTAIHNSKFVITDSFHTTMFAILMHRPFISLNLNQWGTDWAERVKCLLDKLDLGERFLSNYDYHTTKQIISSNINWDKVDEKIIELRKLGSMYLSQNIL